MLWTLFALLLAYLVILLALLRGRLSHANGLDKFRRGVSILLAGYFKKESDAFSILHGQFGSSKTKTSSFRAGRPTASTPRYQDRYHFTTLNTADMKEARPSFSYDDNNLKPRRVPISSFGGLSPARDSIPCPADLLDEAYYRRARVQADALGCVGPRSNTFNANLGVPHSLHKSASPRQTNSRNLGWQAGGLKVYEGSQPMPGKPKLSRGLWHRSRKQRQMDARPFPMASLSPIHESRDESEEASTTRISLDVSLTSLAPKLQRQPC